MPEDADPMRETAANLRRSYPELYAQSAFVGVECCLDEYEHRRAAFSADMGLSQAPQSPLQQSLPLSMEPVLALALLATYGYVQRSNIARFNSHSVPDTKIWVQVGSVAAALDAARACQPDALVVQGNDAGGHGHASGVSIISLIPEVCDVLHEHRMSQIPLIAAGGIVDGRGVAAAVMLGAAGVVLGTRFLAAEEKSLPGEYREAIINAVDGGVSTVRSRVFDEIWGSSPWPELYDGRSLRNATYADVAAGIPMQEVVRRFYLRLMERQDKEFDVKEAGSVWAGTGVGLVKQIEDVATIICQLRLEVQRFY
ncbi:nitronate monooxygenase [Aspergillus udagawae]|uniref:Nitronate monooxygenase n=1 Tax=Aspergillus udagawae TaxID=91492 RepID=A0A8H3N5W5_9EURO|nr:nitronate monooxygenase [Aspergillus udagawae]